MTDMQRWSLDKCGMVFKADADAYVLAPWDDATVGKLNACQHRGGLHGFTCGTHTSNLLTATRDGWMCSLCDYTQNWALYSMVTLGEKVLRQRALEEKP